jgi:hypothetical protein
MSQLSIKQTSLAVIQSLPESSTLEDIMRQINFAAQTIEGLKDVQEGKTMSSQVLLTKLDEWKYEVKFSRKNQLTSKTTPNLTPKK